ncbi:MAG TPA: hypothetical protein VK937_04460 [Candidatus Limnocylindria bacterium]|nr:hypothetical protein [Candidatus Limnocylindria bacterium]
MKKTAEVICYIAAGVLLLYLVVVALIRGVVIFMAIVLLFAHSPLPWWILGPAAIASSLDLLICSKIHYIKGARNEGFRIDPLPAHSTRHYHRPCIGSFGKTANSNYPSFFLKT